MKLVLRNKYKVYEVGERNMETTKNQNYFEINYLNVYLYDILIMCAREHVCFSWSVFTCACVYSYVRVYVT